MTPAMVACTPELSTSTQTVTPSSTRSAPRVAAFGRRRALSHPKAAMRGTAMSSGTGCSSRVKNAAMATKRTRGHE